MDAQEILKRYKKTVSYEDVLRKAMEIFDDKDKALNWYLSKNPMFEDKAPYEFVKSGHGYHVMRILERCHM